MPKYLVNGMNLAYLPTAVLEGNLSQENFRSEKVIVSISVYQRWGVMQIRL